MKATIINDGKTSSLAEKPASCAQCGWPGIGTMPAGQQTITKRGKHLRIGKLIYYRSPGTLCAVCQDMQSALSGRVWFVRAHAEYLDAVAAKRRLLSGQGDDRAFEDDRNP